MVEFVSYDGSFPCLCHGTLVLKINGETVSWGYGLSSGGCVWFSNGWADAHVEEGLWTVYVPEEYEQYHEEIEDIVNENVSHGCCGECI